MTPEDRLWMAVLKTSSFLTEKSIEDAVQYLKEAQFPATLVQSYREWREAQQAS